MLNGSPTDNNATLFKQGYDAVINPKFDSGEWTQVDDQSVPDWDNQKGGQIFEQMLTKAGGKIDGVLAANDGLGNAAIAVLKKNNLQVPVTGQDATPEGLQNILAGDQCMTVYKAVKKEADGCRRTPPSPCSAGRSRPPPARSRTTRGGRTVPAVLADPGRHLQGQRQGRRSTTASSRPRTSARPSSRRRARRPASSRQTGSRTAHGVRALRAPVHARPRSAIIERSLMSRS